MKAAFALMTALFLSGCGDSSDPALQNGGANSAPLGLSARITDPQGAAAIGVRVIAQERTSGKQFEGLSQADGTSQISLPDGVYDVALDREGDSASATCFYGPVVVTNATQRTFVLQSSQGLPASRVFGKVGRLPGLPLANQQLVLRPTTVRGEDDSSLAHGAIAARTDGNGLFSTDLRTGMDQALDLEILDGSNALVEFVDVFKRDKPCYLEFNTEVSSVTNALRSSGSDIDRTPVAASASVAGPKEVNHSFSSCQYQGFNNLYRLEGGRLSPEVAADPQYLSELVPSVPFQTDLPELYQILTLRGAVGRDGCKIVVDKNHAWYWGDYAVHVNPYASCNWAFIDETNDRYTLCVAQADNRWHRVSYRSAKPAITTVLLMVAPI